MFLLKFSNYKNELKTDYLLAEKIIYSQSVAMPEALLHDAPPQAVLGVKVACVIQKGGCVLLDFGAEICGGIEITLSSFEASAAKLRVVFGESVMESLSSIGEKNSTNNHAVRDDIITVVPLSTLKTGNTGFRFVKLEAVSCDIAILGVKAVANYRDIEYKGSFQSDDSRLDRIYATAARTVHLNMQDYLWDGIKRDRLVWVGDMHVEVSTIASVFGYNSVVNKSLDLISDMTPADRWMNNIPSYSFWWLIIQNDWYRYTGDFEYISSKSDYIFSLTQKITDSVRGEGIDRFETDSENDLGALFIDWETRNLPEASNGFYAVLVMALGAAADLCRVLGRDELAQQCIQKIQFIKTYRFAPTSNKQLAALMALSGLADINKINREVLSKDETAGISAFMGYYTLLAKGMAGDVSGALNVIRRYWGAMLDLGATSFWESFDLAKSEGACGIDQIVPPGGKDIHGDYGAYCYEKFRCSLCHGWSSGPAPFIAKYVLGVTPLEAGFKKTLVKPQLGDLGYIHGTLPTPYGNIEITAEKHGEKTHTSITAPDEIEIIK